MREVLLSCRSTYNGDFRSPLLGNSPRFLILIKAIHNNSLQFLSEKTKKSISLLLQYRQKWHNTHYIWQISVIGWSFINYKQQYAVHFSYKSFRLYIFIFNFITFKWVKLKYRNLKQRWEQDVTFWWLKLVCTIS